MSKAKWLGLALLVGSTLGGSARAEEEATWFGLDPGETEGLSEPAVEDRVPLKPFEFQLRFGPSFGWYWGAGHLELDFGVRLSERLQLVPAIRTAGGIGTRDLNYFEYGGDLGLRLSKPKRVSGVWQFGAGALSLNQLRDHGGIADRHVVPYGRLGGGVRVVGEGRLAWGVEGTARLGAALHHGSPAGVAPVVGDVFYGNVDLSFVLAF